MSKRTVHSVIESTTTTTIKFSMKELRELLDVPTDAVIFVERNRLLNDWEDQELDDDYPLQARTVSTERKEETT